MKIKRALISVSDKTGLVDFARELRCLGIEIISTGGTANLLQQHETALTEISEYTGFPEMMDGRLKTLHPKIHGGILGRRGVDDETMIEHNITGIDLVVVNLYPFQQTIARDNVTLAAAIENIDIGGPAMVRAAAKNHESVAVVVDCDDYTDVIAELKSNNGTISQKTSFKLAVKAFSHTAQYDGAISNYLSAINGNDKQKFPKVLNLQFNLRQDMRYGENPHQTAAFYVEAGAEFSVASARQIQGKELSYNNVADADAALECVKEFTVPACVIVKHANPCGVALGDSIYDAYTKAFKTDPTSAFGGIIAFNRELDLATAKEIIRRQFVEVIIAPTVSTDAGKVLADKKNVRVLEVGTWHEQKSALDFKRVTDGLLVQDKDLGMITANDLKTVSKRKPGTEEMQDLLFAWKVCKYVKSNAIVYCKNKTTIGIGAGQMSRVYSAKIAEIKAKDENLTVTGSVMASDAFFPFRDSLDAAGGAGITAVIQPGGSMRDKEVIQAADKHNIAMVFTGMRHFRH